MTTLTEQLDSLPRHTIILATIDTADTKVVVEKNKYDLWGLVNCEDRSLDAGAILHFEVLRVDFHYPPYNEPMPFTIQPPTTTASLWFVDDGYAERLDTISSAHGFQMRSLVMAKALLDNASADIEALIEHDEGPV